MPTDTERREVTRRLRGDPCDTLIPYRTGVHFGMGCHEAASRFWDMCERIKSAGDYDIAYSARSVLADLIEPSCDRDALLALADNLDGSASMLLKQNDLDPNRKRRGMRRDHAQSLMAASGRIREACGEAADG